MPTIENRKIAIEFAERPFRISRIRDIEKGVGYELESRELEILVSTAKTGDNPPDQGAAVCGPIMLEAFEPRIVDCAENRLTVTGKLSGLEVELAYATLADLGIVEKMIRLKNNSNRDIRLRSVRQGLMFTRTWRDRIRCVTFGEEEWAAPCPIGYFFRGATAGLYWGMGNPFFEMARNGGYDFLTLQCAVVVEPGHEFALEETLFGVHGLSGRTYRPHEYRDDVNWNPIHFPVNPGGQALDELEIEAMQAYVEHKSPARRHLFSYYVNSWTMDLPMNIGDADAAEEYEKAIDRIRNTPVDIFNVIGGWFADARELPPETQRDLAQLPHLTRVLAYARKRRCAMGLFVSVSVGDYRGRKPHVPLKPEWQVAHNDATRGPDLCLAHREGMAWLKEVVCAWIATSAAQVVSYDFLAFPECYDARHSHLPGAGTKYLQWRGGLELMDVVRRRFPEVVISCHVGYMAAMPWSARSVSETHLYYDFTHSVLCPFHTLSMDQILADNLRLNVYWKHKTAFLPPNKLLALAGHYVRGNAAFDYGGWQYAVLSALAFGAESVGLCNLPLIYEKGFGKDAIEFLNIWKEWARANQRFREKAIPILGEPDLGKADGYAQVDGNEGFLFIFNPNPRSLPCSIRLDREIGFTGDHPVFLRRLYPWDTDNEAESEKTPFAPGARLEFLLNPHSAHVFQLTPRPSDECRHPAKSFDRLQRELTHWNSESGIVVLPNELAMGAQLLQCDVTIPFWVREELESRRVADYPNELTDFFPCVDPSRLLLELAFLRPWEMQAPRLRVNGSEVVVRGFYRAEKPEEVNGGTEELAGRLIVYWADLSGVIGFGQMNAFKLEISRLEAEQFQAALLYNVPFYPTRKGDHHHVFRK